MYFLFQGKHCLLFLLASELIIRLGFVFVLCWGTTFILWKTFILCPAKPLCCFGTCHLQLEDIYFRRKGARFCWPWQVPLCVCFSLCGYPPFYSNHGAAISPGMKKRIRNGQYEFPNPEWSRVSQEGQHSIYVKFLNRVLLTGIITAHKVWYEVYISALASGRGS